MSFGFTDLQELIGDWDGLTPVPGSDFRDGIYDRLCQILRAARAQRRMSRFKADLAPLVRHCLLKETARIGQRAVLRVPLGQGWPSQQDWDAHAVQALSGGEDGLVLTADGWYPDWLKTADAGVFHAAFTDQQVRAEASCAADPFVAEATGFKTYSSPGQREALRAVFLMKAGDTLLVNLPTGSGKSLVGQAPALLQKLEGALTIVVVPTVALALDQARAMEHFIRQTTPNQKVWPLAWHADLDDAKRAEIRARLRAGTQRILFTSPEALTTTLLSTVTEVTRAGMLQYLVIDEAHLVTGWGDSFRPAFQLLAGLRNNLMRVAPHGFRTVLLSATYTQETIDTLATLFGPSKQVHMVSAVHLRPEPQYWFSHAADPHEKHEHVLAALRHAPRPFILYVTTRAEIRLWNDILRQQAGLTRLACFDGSTSGSERNAIIHAWSGNQLDGIIATSAFGVGIDKADVRTVIHATIPETLDRYYQEVGRGGRDGSPCVSLLVYDDKDWRLPRRLARPMIISQELGISRWKAMYQTRRATDQANVFAIDVEARRAKLPRTSEYNVDWNMRTLILMARAGLISLEIGTPPSDQAVSDVDKDEASSLLAVLASIRVRILDDGHLLPEVWERRVSESRRTTLNAAGRNLALMQDLLKGEREVSETLAQLYRVNTKTYFVPVTRVCGGCPVDRFDPEVRCEYRVPEPTLLTATDSANFAEWTRRFPWIDPTFAYVFYDDERPIAEVHQAIVRFVEWLVQECGVREVATETNSGLSQLPGWQHLYRRAPNGVVIQRSLKELQVEPYTPLARVTVLDATSAITMLEPVQMLVRPQHLVLLPRSLPDPSNPTRTLAEVTQAAAYLQQLLLTIRQ